MGREADPGHFYTIYTDSGGAIPAGLTGESDGDPKLFAAIRKGSARTKVRRVECGPDVVARLRSATKGDVVVEVEQIEPGCHVLAILIELADALGEELQRFNVAIRAAPAEIGAPL